MSELSPADLELLARIFAGGVHGGLRLDPRYEGELTRQQQRLIDAGFVELRGDRLHVTHVGAELLRTQEVP